MKFDCPDCNSKEAVFWFISRPEIWKCSVCTTLLHPREIQEMELQEFVLKAAANEGALRQTQFSQSL